MTRPPAEMLSDWNAAIEAAIKVATHAPASSTTYHARRIIAQGIEALRRPQPVEQPGEVMRLAEAWVEAQRVFSRCIYCTDTTPDDIEARSNALDVAKDAFTAALSQPSGEVMVYVAICIADDGDETTHIFSTKEASEQFCKSDQRKHVVYDYLLDSPARHEGATQ
jgi:hypothetical protein